MVEGVRGQIRQRTLERNLTKGFVDYIGHRFNVMPSSTVKVDIGLESNTEGVEWKMGGIKYHAAFFLDREGQPKFFIKLDYPKKRGLGKRIIDKLPSKNAIDSSSYLGRTTRSCDDKSYIALCKLKKSSQKPDKRLYDSLFGYLMKQPLITISPELA